MRALLCGMVLAMGCGSEAEPQPEGQAGAAGALEECPPGELEDASGACMPAGVPPDACAAGFQADGNGGCAAIVPSEACDSGSIAYLGETRCHELMACGSAPWGDIAVDATTEFVDGSYTGVSDGSATAPWRTIQEGIDNAAPAAVVALAQGTYAEAVTIAKPIELRGRCPSLVHVLGPSPGASIRISSGSDGTLIDGLSLANGEYGALLYGGRSLRLERLWVHDTEKTGVQIGSTPGGVEAVMRECLVERVSAVGVLVAGSELILERAVVRDTQTSGGQFGRGITATPSGGLRSALRASGVWVEHNRDIGIEVAGSDAVIEGTLVRDTIDAGGGGQGRGIFARPDDSLSHVASLTVRASLVEAAQRTGVALWSAAGTIEATVVRDTRPGASDSELGRGISAEEVIGLGARPQATVLRSVLERNYENGIALAGAEARLESTIVRDTLPELAFGGFGYGISARDHPGGARSTATVLGCLLQRNHRASIAVEGSDATVEHTLIEDTLAADGLRGRGINAQDSKESGERASLVVRATLVRRSIEAGIAIIDADGLCESSATLDTAATSSGLYGDGILVWAHELPASLAVVDVAVERSARSGLVAFGASVSLQSALLACNTIDLVVQPWQATPGTFSDEGGNRCGCGDAFTSCKASGATVEPPPPFTP